MAQRPILVEQRESAAGQFWVVIRGGNGEVCFTSETYYDRSGAIRSAKQAVKLIDRDVPVVFSYWRGNRPPLKNANLLPPKQVVERIR